MGILDSFGIVVREQDLHVLCVLHGWGHGAVGQAVVALTWLGSGWTAVVLLPMACHPRTRDFARNLIAALAVQAVLVWAIKGLTARVRPWITLGWPAPLWAPHDGSFPSGHSSGTFCVAVFLFAWPLALNSVCAFARRVPGVVAAVVAALVALSRVVAGAHFPSDVLGGAVVGSLVGLAAARARAFGVEASSESRY